ncbi:hypothetical protein EMPG_09432 [Blastomyces silverae]|uniref:Uncharacterized protein n=1 Tax=Blastomyces silverae TaxID=2060906 RepID=A0A0H1BQ04_9EURO|nr:hypothetical protein EMPG_09432 [Blastomyces silverae]
MTVVGKETLNGFADRAKAERHIRINSLALAKPMVASTLPEQGIFIAAEQDEAYGSDSETGLKGDRAALMQRGCTHGPPQRVPSAVRRPVNTGMPWKPKKLGT